MTQHTNFSTRLDELQQRVAQAKASTQTAVDETDAQLVERINAAQVRPGPVGPECQAGGLGGR